METAIGPAERVVTMPGGLPEWTLGWDAIKWGVKYLRQPDGDNAGERWHFTDSQILFLLWWYAVDPRGQWLYTHGCRRLPKGSGKSPFAAVLSLIELCAPVRFKCFAEDESDPTGFRAVGKPVGMPLVQIAATAQEQGMINTMRMVTALINATKDGLKRGQVSRLQLDYGLEIGKTQISKPGGGFLHVITSSAAAAEGALTTFGICDQALALDTPMPTPTGWTTVGAIRPGDAILGRDGKPCTVTYTTPVRRNRECYRVTLSDGHMLYADAGHLWLGSFSPGHSDQRFAAGRVMTTREMADSGKRVFIPMTAPVELPEADLPIDPYVLGYWLGDGNRWQAAISCSADDSEWLLGEMSRHEKCHRTEDKLAIRFTDGEFQGATKDGALSKPWSMTARLRELGLLSEKSTGRKPKFVPDIYMRSSAGQRLALLQGLMDSDGCGNGQFSNKEPQLSQAVAELARSLGYKVRTGVMDCWESTASAGVCEGYDGKQWKYMLAFTPRPDMNPFRMPRKRVKVGSARKYNGWMAIESIEPCESVPVKCIEVDSPDHLFLAGKSWIATHNTEAWMKTNGGHDLFQVMDRNAAKSKSRLIQTANAWEPGYDSVAEQTFDAWVAEQEGRTRGSAKTLMDVRQMPAECLRYTGEGDDKEIDRDELVRGVQFAYGDCNWVDAEDIVDNHVLDVKAKFDTSKRFYFNWPTVPEDAWCEPWEFYRWRNEGLTLEDGAEIALGFDGSRTNDATALIACEIKTGDIFDLGIWETHQDPQNPRQRIHIPVDEVDAAVERAFARWNPLVFFADVREWESFTKVEWPKRYGSRLKLWANPGGRDPQPIAWDMRIHTSEFTAAAEMVNEEVRGDARVFSYDGSGILAKHVVQMKRRPNRFGISVGKEAPLSPKKIDAGVSMIIARHARRMYLASLQERPDNKQKKTGGQVWSFT